MSMIKSHSRGPPSNGCGRPAVRAQTETPMSPAATVRPAPVEPGAAFRDLDRLREAALARASFGFSPEALQLAWADWALHLAGAPGKRLSLALQPPWPTAADPAADPRFAAPQWQQSPFRQWAQAFLQTEAAWQHATHDVPGTEPHHEQVVGFLGRQWLDMLSPANLPLTNPEVLARTFAEGGMNLWRGGLHFLEDLARRSRGAPPAGSEDFVVGRDVACTPGKVVLRTPLAELIQYAPTTSTVHAEPILLVPAWIMKYYVLDLSPHDSMVRWLVDQGHTVFCLSWRNVTEADRDVALDDYRTQGLVAALDAIAILLPRRRVHAVGYCLGGTLLAIGAAAMARAGDRRLASVTLLAAQTDFTEPGELQLFIDRAQVHMLDSMMWERGVLTAGQMTGAFQMLQSREMLWSHAVHDYLLGERTPMNDLMAWNADTTRMPARMHSQYLHRLFLGNDLAAGRYLVDGHPVALQNIRVPIFAVGTERDHVAPWHSVYKIHYLADTALTFVLTSGGHNAGIVSEPGHPHRHYRLLGRAADAPCLAADEWQLAAPRHEGSWWPAWQRWLVGHSGRRRIAPPPLGTIAHPPLADAPGEYVHQR